MGVGGNGNSKGGERGREVRVKVKERKGEGRDRGGRECTYTTKAIKSPPHLSPGAWEMILLFSNRYFSIDALYTQT